MIQLQNTAAMPRTGAKILVYGRAGVGKTRLCATMPSPVIFSAEGGLLSLRRVQLPYVQIDSLAKLDEVYDWSVKSNEAKQFHSLCLDSISEIAEIILKTELNKTKDPRKAYGELLIQTVDRIKKFRTIENKNVYFTSKEQYATDGITGATYFGPLLPGKALGQDLPYQFDEVFRLATYKDVNGKDFEVLQCRADNQAVAKDRSGMLDVFEPPDLGRIIAKIYA